MGAGPKQENRMRKRAGARIREERWSERRKGKDRCVSNTQHRARHLPIHPARRASLLPPFFFTREETEIQEG